MTEREGPSRRTLRELFLEVTSESVRGGQAIAVGPQTPEPVSRRPDPPGPAAEAKDGNDGAADLDT